MEGGYARLAMAMPPESKASVYNVIGLVCAIWFLLTGWIWAYLICVVVSYPFAIIALFLCRAGKKLAPGATLNRIAWGVLIAGSVLSITALFLYR